MRIRNRLIAFTLALGFAAGMAGLAVAGGTGEHSHAKPAAAKKAKPEAEGHTPMDLRLMMPVMNARRGMKLFVDKGCVACHAVNGVGGHDATALDAHSMDPFMNPFEFAAKMWRMAPAMIAAQEEALGEQIYFTGDELADIVAFIHDDKQQHTFSDANLTPRARKLMKHGHGKKEPHQEEIGHEKMPGMSEQMKGGDKRKK